MKGALSRRTILLLTISIAGCSGAPTRPESVGRGDYAKVAEYVSALIRHEMKKRDVTGLSIALVDDQRVVWAEGFGYADKAGSVPASPDTVYRAGSIPLLFPGTASFAVAPVSDAEAVIRGFGRGMGETVRTVTVNGENMLSYSGYLLRKRGK